MGLNQTQSIPNSTDVWWEMTANRSKFKFNPSCRVLFETILFKNKRKIYFLFAQVQHRILLIWVWSFSMTKSLQPTYLFWLVMGKCASCMHSFIYLLTKHILLTACPSFLFCLSPRMSCQCLFFFFFYLYFCIFHCS